MRISIAGMDPSLRNWGIALATLDLATLQYEINDLVLVDTEKGNTKQVRVNCDDLRRARDLHEGVASSLQRHLAKIAFVEIPVGSQSARAMASYGMCIGVLGGLPSKIIEVLPAEVKLAAIGSKQAAKEEMIEWAAAKFPNAPWLKGKVKGQLRLLNSNEHLADAVAAIEAGLKTDEFQRLHSMMQAAA